MSETDLLRRDLERLDGRPCAGCGRALCGHHHVASVALGFKDAPRCLPCFAAALAQPEDVLRARLLDYVQGKDCYREAWSRASAREGAADCLGADPKPDVEWDAGDMGCGDLVLELRMRLQGMAPGTLIRVTARDPGAPADMPAWCGMTGHSLVHSKHPVYVIRRKEG